MKVKIKIIIIGILLIFLSGCVFPNTYLGTYRSQKNPKQTIELRDDGTYILNPGDPAQTFKGTYVKKNDKIELNMAFGYVRIMTISDKGLLDIDGDIWKKVS